MKRNIAVLLVILTLFTLVACAKQEVHVPTPTKPSPSSTPNTKPVQETQPNVPVEFDPMPDNLDTISRVADLVDNGNNVMYSPLSLNFALALLSLGGNEEIKKDFENYFGVPFDKYLDFYKNYIYSLDSTTEVANAVWLNDGLEYAEDFANKANEYFKAELGIDNFDAELVRKINNWCSEKTHGMIPSIIDDLNPSATSIILNALYFKGQWKVEYKESRKTTFYGKDGNHDVDGLFSEEKIYLENDFATGFMKYYDGDRYAFVGILPKESEWTFESLDLKSLMESKCGDEVNVMIPKFEFECSYDLSNIIKNVGLGNVYRNGAFPNIAKDSIFVVDQVIQKTKIKLDEHGTEAAAVTAIITKADVAQKTHRVYLDKPFAFMIYDTQTDTVLFIGKVINPN